MFLGHMLPLQLMRLVGLDHHWRCFAMLRFFTILAIFHGFSRFLVGSHNFSRYFNVFMGIIFFNLTIVKDAIFCDKPSPQTNPSDAKFAMDHSSLILLLYRQCLLLFISMLLQSDCVKSLHAGHLKGKQSGKSKAIHFILLKFMFKCVWENRLMWVIKNILGISVS